MVNVETVESRCCCVEYVSKNAKNETLRMVGDGEKKGKSSHDVSTTATSELPLLSLDLPLPSI